MISLRITGISYFEDSFGGYKAEALAFAASWLFVYAMFKFKAAITPYIAGENYELGHTSFGRTLGSLFFVTFGNPHVYLDNVLLIGTISIQFSGEEKAYYGLGVCLASVSFFFSLGYFGVFLGRFVVGACMWRLVDISVAIIMVSLSCSMLRDGGWIKI